VLIVFTGLPGTGKSTLALAVGRALGVPVLSVDPIESAMLRAGVVRSFETGLAAQARVHGMVGARARARCSRNVGVKRPARGALARGSGADATTVGRNEN
jgi:predicted kinase